MRAHLSKSKAAERVAFVVFSYNEKKIERKEEGGIGGHVVLPRIVENGEKLRKIATYETYVRLLVSRRIIIIDSTRFASSFKRARKSNYYSPIQPCAEKRSGKGRRIFS